MAFHLTSSAFDNDDEIPVAFTADGKDISPPLSWSRPPTGTITFALVVEDRDATPTGIHWALWNIPGTRRSLREDIKGDPVLKDGTHQGLNNFRKVGYSGPRLARVTEHKYTFTLYALNSKLDLKAGSTQAELIAVMGGPADAGHILAETTLVGRFKPQRDDARMRALEGDTEYIHQSDEIKQGLEQAHNIRPKEVAEFFRKFSLPSAFAMEEVRAELNKINDDVVRRNLENYIAFANRFRVQLRLKTTIPLKHCSQTLVPSFKVKSTLRLESISAPHRPHCSS